MVTGRPKGPIRRAPLVLAAGLAVLIAGCGGGGSSTDTSSSEAALRQKLQQAFVKTGEAQSARFKEVVEASESGELEPVACLEFSIDRGPPEKVEARLFRLECGGEPDATLVVIGRRAWATSVPGQWTEFKAGPDLVAELDDQLDKFRTIVTHAENIDQTSEGTFEFEAPTAAFGEAFGDEAPEKISLKAVTDSGGRLSSVEFSAGQGDVEAIGTDTFGDFGVPQPIAAPPPGQVVSHRGEVDDKAEFEALLESSLGSLQSPRA